MYTIIYSLFLWYIYIAMVAEAFYAWVQAKNEAEVEKAERKKRAVKHYRLKAKARVFYKWKVHELEN